jgi:pimeloyl-ACP methyl ester carboxylesterase
MVRVGSHRLQISLEGQGAPAVVIDAGLGEGIDRWRAMQARIARVTRVMTYNRAGYGASEPGPVPRDCAREAEELKALLDSASVAGPYVLVGHSLGALNIQVFASRYPDDVVGMVLLDPPPLSFILRKEYTALLEMADGMTAQWQSAADSGAEAEDPQARTQAAFLRMLASEHRELFGATAKIVSGIDSFGRLPLLVMAAGKPNPAFGEIAEEYQAYWVDQSRALSLKSSIGRFDLAEESGHHLYLDVPDRVEAHIVSSVRKARGKD